MTYSYPTTRRGDDTDDFWGNQVADPYRWLEDPDSPETQAWVDAQNEVTFAHLRGLPARSALRSRMEELWDFPRWTAPVRRGRRLFFTKNDGLQNQPVLYRQDGLKGEPVVLLDPNTLTEDGTTALVDSSASDDGSLLAISIAESGSDWQTISILDVETGTELPDRLRNVKFTSIAWLPDGRGFFYSRFPTEDEIPDAPPSTHQRVYSHLIGTAQDQDELVYARPDAPDLGFMPFVSDDGRYLVLHVWEGTDSRNRLYYRPLDGDGDFVLLLDEFDARYEFIEHLDGRFLILTDLDAPLGRIVAIDLNHPDRDDWVEIVPQGEDALVHGALTGGRLITMWMHHAHHLIRIHDASGAFVDEPPLPGLGSVVELTGRPGDRDLFIGYQSFTQPPTVLRYDFETGTLGTMWTASGRDDDRFRTRQGFATSPDGTRVPMFLIGLADLEPDGATPTILYGYGGFDISLTPTYQPARLAFLEAGGLFAVANLRGGSEYGQAWHQAGMLVNKQNVFDDFIACAEYLIEEGITSADHLGILGGSNGGLLVSAVELQRPELFGAVVPVVPVTDMLRYHRFTAGRYWIPEYGNAEESREHFEFLIEYSPLHNVEAGVTYPPTLITTADTDDRVVPMHAYKFTATMQAQADPSSPLLLRVETRAGHGLGKPTAKVIEEAADIYAFFLHHLR
ncbi:MAG: prolyl oligopeptidase family serine peptidase [Acidimicrobiia bacterium]|nr:prolyl oligopeptidase family serine peptidase [Acidimicrobiia bacterium]